jgi:uncharacterized membrane protein YeaQ/YmgE (transglycosylase-associated protein family)
VLHYLWVIIIGFFAGLIARFIMPGDNEPSGFVMTAILGIVGSVLANFIAVKIGWIHGGGEGVSLLSGVVGAVIILFIYHLITNRGTTAI